MARLELPRLYAILDRDLLRARGLEPITVLDAWLEAGVRLVQLRAKSLGFGAMLHLAEMLARRCEGTGALFLVNDRADVARLSGAAGVHLGQDDLAPPAARQLLALGQYLGVSTHDRTQVASALAQEPDYVAIGPVFATTTKVRPDPVIGLAGVREAAEILRDTGRPLVAIGGITLASAREVLAAGADSIAVAAGLLSQSPSDRIDAWLAEVG